NGIAFEANLREKIDKVDDRANDGRDKKSAWSQVVVQAMAVVSVAFAFVPSLGLCGLTRCRSDAHMVRIYDPKEKVQGYTIEELITTGNNSVAYSAHTLKGEKVF